MTEDCRYDLLHCVQFVYSLFPERVRSGTWSVGQADNGNYWVHIHYITAAEKTQPMDNNQNSVWNNKIKIIERWGGGRILCLTGWMKSWSALIKATLLQRKMRAGVELCLMVSKPLEWSSESNSVIKMYTDSLIQFKNRVYVHRTATWSIQLWINYTELSPCSAPGLLFLRTEGMSQLGEF